MQLAISSKAYLSLLAGLTVLSVGIKARAAPPWMGVEPNLLVQHLADTLKQQGFDVSIRRMNVQSSIVLGARGNCRLSVRDATEGVGSVAVFAEQARGIGPVEYLYRHRTYQAPPTFAMRLGRLQAEVSQRLGLHLNAHVPVALATSPSCPTDLDFGDVSVRK